MTKELSLPFGFPLEGIPLAGNHPQIALLTDPPQYPAMPQAAPSAIAGHVQGLPVAGYAKNVEQWRIDMVNENKILEERVLRRVDEHVRNRDSREIDQASVQLARRHVEDAFYRLNRAIMQPARILKLPEDPE